MTISLDILNSLLLNNVHIQYNDLVYPMETLSGVTLLSPAG